MKIQTKVGARLARLEGAHARRVIAASQIPPPAFRKTTRWHFELEDAMRLQSGQALALRGIGYTAYTQIKSIVAYRGAPLRVQKRGEDVYLERLEE